MTDTANILQNSSLYQQEEGDDYNDDIDEPVEAP